MEVPFVFFQLSLDLVADARSLRDDIFCKLIGAFFTVVDLAEVLFILVIELLLVLLDIRETSLVDTVLRTQMVDTRTQIVQATPQDRRLSQVL